MKHLNKLRVALCAAAVVVAVAFFACNKENEPTTQQTTELIQNEIDMVDPTENILFLNRINDHHKGLIPGVDILIIKLHRKSMNYDKKLGICEIWFMGSQLYTNMNDSILPSREIYYELEHNEKSDKLLLLLASDVSGIAPSELKLFVDEDIYGYDESMTKCVSVPQGVYLYDPNLGEYGGYSVNYSFRKLQ